MASFGFASDNLRLSRFSKGEASLKHRTADANGHSGDIAYSTLFACGDLGGSVHIWDLRNVKQPATQVSLVHLPSCGYLNTRQAKCFQTKIKTVTWHESHILASSNDNHIAAIPYTYTDLVMQPT